MRKAAADSRQPFLWEIESYFSCVFSLRTYRLDDFFAVVGFTAAIGKQTITLGP